jgi:hypothetical protein
VTRSVLPFGAAGGGAAARGRASASFRSLAVVCTMYYELSRAGNPAYRLRGLLIREEDPEAIFCEFLLT